MLAEFQRVKEIFLAAVETVTPEEREACLRQECAGDPALRRQVEALLRKHEQVGSFLEPATVDSLPQALDEDEPAESDAPLAPGGRGIGGEGLETAGTRLGSYNLLQQLGEGGMGVVWVAEQTEPVKRRVALKVIKPGMDSAQVLRRFEAERQALALMDHPHIAKVLDAGTTPEGRPYFVMELVKGVPITKYCDELHLSVRERLALFVPVCRAIQHAHQKAVIHRDVKPSNVLVCMQDGRPVAKVIDFGVAKALHHRLTDGSLYTEVGQVMGTLEYMAPEQAELSALDIDTRADVYGLGVLLYQLLTGTTPLDGKRLRKASPVEALRLIKEEEPPKPSTRLTQSGEALADLAARRRTEPARLKRQVRGELDWIVMKCLEKDRTRRYETANGLARDVERYLADEPVEACPPSRWYRLGKVVRRHRGAVLASAVMAVLLLAGILGTTLGLVRARRAQAEAEAARRRTREALDTLTNDVVGDLLGQRAELGEKEKAFLRRTLRLYAELARSEGETEQARADRAAGLYRVGRIHERLGELGEAELAYGQAVALQQGLVADFPAVAGYRRELARSHNQRGVLLSSAGRPEAEAVFREALALQERLVADFPDVADYRRELAGINNNLGVLLRNMGRLEEAEAAFREALAFARRLVADAPPDPEYRRYLAACHANLGNVLKARGRPEAAEAALQEALALYRRLAAESPANPDCANELASTLVNLSRLKNDAGDPAGARRLLEEARTYHQTALKANPRNPAYRRASRDNKVVLCVALLALGDHAAASATAGELARFSFDPVHDVYDAACYAARCVPLAEKDDKLPEAKRKELAKEYADRALALLRRAVQAGWKDVAHMKKDKDLDSLRDRDDFRQLVADLEKPPAAPGTERKQ